MFRIFLVILFIVVSVEGFTQSVTVPKSKEVIVLRGKSYYLHTVVPGQTLYSICKAYGVDIENVKGLNNKKDNALSQYEVLKIPYIEPQVMLDDNFYYHKVVKGETIYSIARHYDIKPKRLLKYNTEYEKNASLAVGHVVKIPLTEIDPSMLEQIKQQASRSQQTNREKPATPPVANVAESGKSKETHQPVKPVVKETESLHPSKPVVPIKSVIAIESEPTSAKQNQMPAHLSEVVMPANPFVKIALLLPFSAGEYPRYTDSIQGHRPVAISARSEQFLSFYEGILLAVDSLKKNGSLIDLHVYDTERNSEKMNELAKQLNYLQPDLIIGPIYGSVYKMLAEQIENKNIPLIYPLSSRNENFGVNPNYVQVNASVEVLANQMRNWLQQQASHANLICLNLTEAPVDLSETLPIQNKVTTIPEMHSFKWNVSQLPLLDTLRTLLLPDRENILVLPVAKEVMVGKILPLLSALADGYRITVVGLPEWQTFSSVDHETYYKLNTKMFTYSYVDYSFPEASEIANNYRKYFYTEPNSLVFKAFDMGMYFIRLAEKYRDRALEAMEYYEQPTSFSKFNFERIPNEQGLENHGFFIVNYGADYRLKITDR